MSIDEERRKRWDDAIAAVKREIVLDDMLDTVDDVQVVRECLIRTRLAASAERQSHEARAIVVDMQKDAAGGPRFVLCTPTGDRVELRELAADVFAAAMIGARDAADLSQMLAPGADDLLSEHARRLASLEEARACLTKLLAAVNAYEDESTRSTTTWGTLQDARDEAVKLVESWR